MKAPSTFDQTLADARLQQAVYAATGRLGEKRRNSISPETIPDFQDLRQAAHELKKHTLENLDYYLELAESRITEHGGKVIWARDGNDVIGFLKGLIQRSGARLLVKSKSMTTEEIHLNDHIESGAVEVVETDLGEYIIQLARQRPYHIVAPALHMTRYEVADLFTEKLHIERQEVPEQQTMIARAVLREKFLSAGIGITGANFVAADAGAVVLVENEGNARLTSSAPKVHVAIAGIEKLIPRLADLGVFLKLLGRSATGQPLTVYTSILSGPRRSAELDGPEEFYVVFLDNGRSRLLADVEKRQSLYCIRCGACLNHCPVYRKIGGHNYPGAYSGPIGAILQPQYAGILHDPWLPSASSLCGACAEVCPVKIDIPKVLLSLRAEVVEQETQKGSNRLEKLGFQLWAWLMRHPKLFEMAGAAGSGILPEGNEGFLQNGPFWLKQSPAGAWLRDRDLPRPAAESFRQLWRKRESGGTGNVE